MLKGIEPALDQRLGRHLFEQDWGSFEHFDASQWQSNSPVSGFQRQRKSREVAFVSVGSNFVEGQRRDRKEFVRNVGGNKAGLERLPSEAFVRNDVGRTQRQLRRTNHLRPLFQDAEAAPVLVQNEARPVQRKRKPPLDAHLFAQPRKSSHPDFKLPIYVIDV